MTVISTVGKTSMMHPPTVLLHALVGAVLSAQTLALTIHVSPARRVVIRTRTTAARLGVMQHPIVYSLAPVDRIVNALMIHSAFRTHHVIKMNHLCAEQALRTHLPVNALVPREAVVNVLLVNLASPVRLAELRNLPRQQIKQNLLQVPFSVEPALGMQPHLANMHVLGEYTRTNTPIFCLTFDILISTNSIR